MEAVGSPPGLTASIFHESNPFTTVCNAVASIELIFASGVVGVASNLLATAGVRPPYLHPENRATAYQPAR